MTCSEIYICIFGCITVEKYKNQIQKIKETWAQSKRVRSYFFLGEERLPCDTTFEGEEFVYLPGVGNDYFSAIQKQTLGIQYIINHHPNVEWIYVCGTDTYVCVDKLIQFLGHFDCHKSLCIGGHQDVRTILGEEIPFFYGGAGFLLSRSALSQIHPRLDTMVEEWSNTCNVSGMTCLLPAGDCCIAYYVKQLGIQRSVFKYRFYECNYQGTIDLTDFLERNHGLVQQDQDLTVRNFNCCKECICTKNIITCHNMSLDDFTALHQKLSISF